MLENEATMMNEVVAYIRCSTDEQAKAGFSVEAQKEELQRVAALESTVLSSPIFPRPFKPSTLWPAKFEALFLSSAAVKIA